MSFPAPPHTFVHTHQKFPFDSKLKGKGARWQSGDLGSSPTSTLNGNFLLCSPICKKWKRFSVQFSSITQSYLTLCDPMNCSTSGLPVHHQLLESTQTHVHWVGVAIQPSHPLAPFSSCLQSFPASGSFPMTQFFASGGQSIEVWLQHQSLQWIFRTDFL